MKTSANRAKRENTSVAQRQHAQSICVSQRANDGRGMAEIRDNRAETVAQRKLQAIINSSPRSEAQSNLGPLVKKMPNNTGMPDQLKAGLESLSGQDMSNVTVHYNSSKPARLNALAYTQGQDIHVAPGQEKHLPHEGWHVVQQMQGRVKPTIQMEGAAINDDRALEQEADIMGRKALQSRVSDNLKNLELSPSPIQMMKTGLEGEVVQRAYVALGPLAQNGGWHINWYNKDLTKQKSIDAHPKSHGKFHAHIIFDLPQNDNRKTVTDIGWGKTGNSKYSYDVFEGSFNHPNTFKDNTGRPFEKDVNHSNLDDKKTLAAVKDVEHKWKSSGYSFLTRNCQHFVREVIKRID